MNLWRSSSTIPWGGGVCLEEGDAVCKKSPYPTSLSFACCIISKALPFKCLITWKQKDDQEKDIRSKFICA